MMKKMIVFILTVVCVVCVFTACSCGRTDTPAASTSSKPTTAVETGDPEPTATSHDREGETCLAGTIVDAEHMTVTIKDEKGNEVTFTKEGADVSGLENGLQIGNDICVYYTGQLDGTDASGVTVTRITDEN